MKTSSGIWWKDLCASKDKHKQMICQPLEDNANPFQSHPFNFKVGHKMESKSKSHNPFF